MTDKEHDLIAAHELAREYEKRSFTMGPDHKWLVLTAIGRGRALAAEDIRQLRFALIQMMPDYAAFIEDAVDHGADETWVEECRQISALARAALAKTEGV